ncbi:MAG: hypothetical protein ACYDCN_02560, partial [Bacteroidia bacterium]
MISIIKKVVYLGIYQYHCTHNILKEHALLPKMKNFFLYLFIFKLFTQLSFAQQLMLRDDPIASTLDSLATQKILD